MNREKNLWNWIRQHLFYPVQLTRIENLVDPGMPDLHVLFRDGMTTWIELKVESARPTRLHLRPTQVNWHRRYSKAGGSSWILVRCEKALWLFPGGWVADLNRKLTTHRPLWKSCACREPDLLYNLFQFIHFNEKEKLS